MAIGREDFLMGSSLPSLFILQCLSVHILQIFLISDFTVEVLNLKLHSLYNVYKLVKVCSVDVTLELSLVRDLSKLR